MRACLACLALALLTGACSQYGRFVNNQNQTFTTLPPTAVVVLYSPEASGELAPELCPGTRKGPLGLLPERLELPPVIQALADTGGGLLGYADCSLRAANGTPPPLSWSAQNPAWTVTPSRPPAMSS